MGHYCRICGRSKPNEKFSGKGHKNHVCKNCTKKPKEERNKIEHKEEIINFMSQSNISKKNISRLKTLSSSTDSEVAELARIVFEVAQLRPHKKNRLKHLFKERKDLCRKLEKMGLIFAYGGF